MIKIYKIGKSKTLKSILNEENITKGGNTNNIPHRVGCASPEVLVNGSPSPDIVGTVSGGNFATIEEIQFVGVIGPLEQKRVCKIKCLNGVWVGPLCALEHGLSLLYSIYLSFILFITLYAYLTSYHYNLSTQ